MGSWFSKSDETPQTKLISACSRNDLKALKSTLADLQRSLADGSTPNASSATGNSLPAFINDTTDEDGRTPLMICARHGSLDCLLVLLQNGADVHRRQRGTLSTALHYASGWGMSSCVGALLDAGADPTALTLKGFSSVDLARKFGRLEALRALEARVATFCGWLQMERSTKFQSVVGGLFGESTKEAVRARLGGDWQEKWVVVTKVRGTPEGASLAVVVCGRCRSNLSLESYQRGGSQLSNLVRCANCSTTLSIPPPTPVTLMEFAIYPGPNEALPERTFPLVSASSSLAQRHPLSPSVTTGPVPGVVIDVFLPRAGKLSPSDVRNLARAAQARTYGGGGGNTPASDAGAGGADSYFGVVDARDARNVIWSQAKLASFTQVVTSNNNNLKRLTFRARDRSQAENVLAAVYGPVKQIGSATTTSLSRTMTANNNNIPSAEIVIPPRASPTRPPRFDSGFGSSSSQEEWACAACTYLNRGSGTACDICLTSRGGGTGGGTGGGGSGSSGKRLASSSPVNFPQVVVVAPPPLRADSREEREAVIVEAIAVPPERGPSSRQLSTNGARTASEDAVEPGGQNDEEEEDEEIEEFLCPLTMEVMSDPVSTADGISYERRAIEEWFANGHSTSPMTGLPLASLTLTPNIALRNAINRFNRKKSAGSMARVASPLNSSNSRHQITVT